MPDDSARRRITIVMARAEGHGGASRTIVNLANALLERYDVEIVSLLRWRTKPIFDIDERIEVRYVQDLRPFGPRGRRRNIGQGGVDEHGEPMTRNSVLAAQKPSAYAPFDPIHWESNDAPLIEVLRGLDCDLVLGTSPALNGFVTRFAPAHLPKVGQDHMNFPMRTRSEERREWMRETVEQLDAFAPLTQADAEDYASLVPDSDTHITAIPNALSWPVAPAPAPLQEKVVLAAGRLDEQKALHRLVDAYAPLAARHPDWRLDIYGNGKLRPVLEEQIAGLGVGDHVRLCGYTRDMPQVMSSASVYAMTSIFEGFPMVLLEAMAVGLPMVAYSCPRGPADLVRDGVNGRLIDDGDSAAFTAALDQVMSDDAARRSMGEQSWRDAHGYQMPAIVDRWVDVFERVWQGRG